MKPMGSFGIRLCTKGGRETLKWAVAGGSFPEPSCGLDHRAKCALHAAPWTSVDLINPTLPGTL